MRKLWSAVLLLATAGPLAAQATASLSLEEAIDLAKKNSPMVLTSRNNRARAEASLKSAYGALLPSANSSLSTSLRQGKQQYFSGVAFGATSDVLNSSWGLDVSARLSARTLATMRSAKAALDASENALKADENSIRSTIIQQYNLAQQMQARAALQDSLVASTQLQLDLARAKAGVGSATSLDVKRAEVAFGQQQVAALRAHNSANVERLRLFQAISIPAPDAVTLTSKTAVTEPTLGVQELVTAARQSNPTVLASRSQVTQAESELTAARGDYLPSVGFNASVGGSAQQYRDGNYLVNQAQNSVASSRANCFTTDSLRRGAGLSGISSCGAIALSASDAQKLRDSNNQFPFGFTPNPYSVSLSVSLPLFDGFSREQRVQAQTLTRSESQQRVRAYELQLVTDITSAHGTLLADYRTVKLLENNTQAARDALRLAEERYRVGLNSLVDLQQSRSDYEKAQTDLIDASFEFHRAYAALENAVGRPLR